MKLSILTIIAALFTITGCAGTTPIHEPQGDPPGHVVDGTGGSGGSGGASSSETSTSSSGGSGGMGGGDTTTSSAGGSGSGGSDAGGAGGGGACITCSSALDGAHDGPWCSPDSASVAAGLQNCSNENHCEDDGCDDNLFHGINDPATRQACAACLWMFCGEAMQTCGRY
jgi:hypothetical protein